MNQAVKKIVSGYWWVLPLLVLVVFSLYQAFVPEKPAYESRLESRINLGIHFTHPSGSTVPITALLQGKLSVSDEQSTQHRFVLLSLWATWCGPCIKELPRISSASERLKTAGILPVLVNYDSGEKAKVFAEVEAWLVAHSVQVPTVYDFESKLSAVLDVTALPFSLLLDRNGNILWMHMGELQDSHLAALIGEFKNK